MPLTRASGGNTQGRAEGRQSNMRGNAAREENPAPARNVATQELPRRALKNQHTGAARRDAMKNTNQGRENGGLRARDRTQSWKC